MPRGSELPELNRPINDADKAIGARMAGEGWETFQIPLAAAVGPAGPRGLRGDQGNDGTPGSDGAKGPVGDQGPTGPDGDKGPAGAKGPNGPNGANGADGRNGPELTTFDTFAYDDFEQQAAGGALGNKGVGFLPADSWATAGVSPVSLVNANTNWGVQQRRVQLGYNPVSTTGAEIGRRMPWGSDWSYLEIYLSLRVDGTASIPAPDAGYALGICSGTSPMWIGNTPNWVGITNWWGATPPFYGSTTYNAGTQNYFHVLSTPTFVYKRGATYTPVSSGVGSAQWGAAGPVGNLSFMRLTILRGADGAGTYTLTAFGGCSATNVEYHMANKKMLWDFAWDETKTNWTSTTSVTESWAFDETTGMLDTFNFWWTSTTNIMQVGAVAIFKW